MNIEAGLIGILIFLLMIITVLASIFIALKYTSTFERHLPNCKLIEDNKATYREAGLVGKIVRCGMIYIFLAFPRLGARRGVINLEDVKYFPKKLKYLLFIPWTSQIIVLIAITWFTQFVMPRT